MKNVGRDDLAVMLYFIRKRAVKSTVNLTTALETIVGKTTLLERAKWNLRASKKLGGVNVEKKLILKNKIKELGLKKSDINPAVLSELKLDIYE